MFRKCEQCGKDFDAKPFDVRRGYGRFCSRRCGWDSNQKAGGKASAWRYFRPNDGRWYRKWREPGSRKIYSQVESRWLWEQANDPIPEGYEIHHRDGDPTNNDLSNLECVTAEWHDNYHQRLREDHVIVDGAELRRCQQCREYRPLGQFATRAVGTYQGYCAECAATYLREWRAKNREHSRTYMREWRAKHRL